MRSKKTLLVFIVFVSLFVPPLTHAQAGGIKLPKCLYVASYHQEFEWNVRTGRGLRSVLDGKCQLKEFYMDTKRHKELSYKKKIALEAKQLIENWNPEVVITSDDNAVKYLVQPYFRDKTLPFVFFGVNWTVDEYDLPYSNVTGMVEVAPIEKMLEQAIELTGGGKRAIYIGADTLSEAKNLERVQKAANKLGMTLDGALVPTLSQWISAYRKGQKYDFIVMGTNTGIDDWDASKAKQLVLEESNRLSVTSRIWMMPFTILGFTKVPEEHGEWAAETALAILDGVQPNQIPIISNWKWDLWVNNPILNSSGISLPKKILKKAKKVKHP